MLIPSSMSARARKQKHAEQVITEPSTPQSSANVSKSVTIEHSRASTPGTPSGRQSFSRSDRSQSPLNISRNEEKDELAHLNDRLAGYIDYVRKLESDKERLTKRIHTVSDERMSKIDETRKTYEDEIAALRDLVDDLARQKTKAGIDAKQFKDDANDSKAKLQKRDQELRNLKRRVESLENDVASYKDSHDRYQPLLSDHHALEKRFEDVTRELQAERLLRTDLENKVLGLKEQLDFRGRLFDEEREKLMQQTIFVEEEVEGRKAAEYESRLADELQNIREQTAGELEEYKIQIEEAFDNKFSHLRSSADQSADDIKRLRSELYASRKHAEDLSHELSRNNSELESLQRRVKDLQNQIERERQEHESVRCLQSEEIRHLKCQLEDSFREFTDLMNIKISLDQEILMYRKMLEGEETRLNIQPKAKESPFGMPGLKRRRTEDFDTDTSLTGTGYSSSKSRFAYRVSSTGSAPVEFFKEQDTEGKWIKLTNSSTEEASLGNWELIHEAGGQESRFKFQRTFLLKPGAMCTIWSANSDATHNPPTDILMKNKSFGAASEVTMTLLDADGKEQAKCTVKRERLRASSANIGRRATHHSRTDEKCQLM